MKKLAQLFCLFIVVSAVSAQSHVKKFSGSFEDAEYEFSVRKTNTSNSKVNLKQRETITYVADHRGTGTPIAGGTVPSHPSSKPDDGEVKSMRINGGILIIKTQNANQYRYQIENYNFSPI